MATFVEAAGTRQARRETVEERCPLPAQPLGRLVQPVLERDAVAQEETREQVVPVQRRRGGERVCVGAEVGGDPA